MQSSPLLTTSGRDQKIRADIQALRGFAVLVVLFYHAGIGSVSGGFLGVDVFFVISGFLITGLIRDGIEAGMFSFWTFYIRRAKRLLPAAYVTFLVTALLAPLFLASSEMRDFQRQLVGSLTFTANFSLLRQSGYFEGDSELKPLLHIWSLAIEEQYYFLLPLILYFLPRRFWKGITLVVTLASLILCWLLTQRNPDAAFYLLPTRAWELGIGSLGALLFSKSPATPRWLQASFWPALGCLLALPFLPEFGAHPGVNALVICLATIVIILRHHPILVRSRVVALLGKFGDISYSLYLVHWPLFAYLNNSWFGDAGSETPPFAWRAGLLLLSLLLAVVLYRTVEKPLHRMPHPKPLRVIAACIAASIAVLSLSRGVALLAAPDVDYAAMRRSNQGLSEKCEFTTAFTAIPECRTSDQPEMLVWGDSFAMHLLGGMAASDVDRAGIIQATRSACGPLLNISSAENAEGSRYNNDWAKDCIAFNDSVVSYLQQSPSIKIVVLSSLLSQYLDGDRFHILERKGDAYSSVPTQRDLAANSLKATVEAIRALGKKVVIVAPPPQSGLDIARCTERLQRGLPVFGIAGGCRIEQASYQTMRKPVLDLLAAVGTDADVSVISFDPLLCREGACDTYLDDTMIYRDDRHFSIDGSAWIGRKMALVEQVKTQAR